MSTTWKHIRRSPYQALAAIFIMSLTFFVATVLATLAFGLSQTLKHYETRPQVISYISNEATTEEVAALRQNLEVDSRVKDVRYVSKEEALEIYKQATSDDPLLAEFVSPNVFQVSLEFALTDLVFAEAVISELKSNEIVTDIDFTATLDDDPESLRGVIENLRNIVAYLRIGGSVIFGFLLFSSFLVLLVIIGMRISSRREEVEILQLLGATPWFIRSPFLLEGIIYGLVGAVAGWFSASLLLLYVYPSIVIFFETVPFLPSNIPALLILLAMVLTGNLIAASSLGLLGGYIATRRYLRR